MLVSEVGSGHGLLFDHVGLVVLVVVPEGLLQLLSDVLDDILLCLCLRGHVLLYDALDPFHVGGSYALG